MVDLPLLRNSERNDFKECPQKWVWRWNMGLVPAMPSQSAAWFGSQWHLLWAWVYTPPGKDGFERTTTNPQEIHDKWDELMRNAYTTVSSAKYFDEDDEKEYWDAAALGHFMIDGQLAKYKLDPGYEVLMPEQRYSIKIPYSKDQHARFGDDEWNWFPDGKFITRAVGTFDLPMRDHTDGRGRVWVLDWKTTNRKVNLKQANKDGQLGMYIAVATAFLRQTGLLGATEEVCGAMWSFAKKAMPPDPTKVDSEGRIRNKPQKKHYIDVLTQLGSLKTGFTPEELMKLKLEDLDTIAEANEVKVWGDVSKQQGGPLFWREPVVRNKANRLRQIEHIAHDAELIALTRGGIIPVTKSPGDHCNWCPFTDLCDIDEDGGDTQGFIDNVFKVEDPYADHQSGADNSKLVK